MQILKTPLRGITHATSDNMCQEGDMSELINLRHKDGSLQPTFNTREVFKITGKTFKKVFVHENGIYQNWLGFDDDAVYWFAYINNGTITAKGGNSTTVPIASIAGFENIEQMGNVVVITNASGIHYLIFKDGAYTLVGDFNTPTITFKPQLRTTNENPAQKMGSITDNEALDYYVCAITPFASDVSTDLGTGEYRKKDFSALKGQITKMRSDLDKYGWLSGFRMVRYALRLFDGNYIMHSAPILIAPPRGADEQFITVCPAINPNPSYLVYFLSLYKVMFRWFAAPEFAALRGIVQSVDIFISQEITRSDLDNQNVRWLYSKDANGEYTSTPETVPSGYVDNDTIGTSAPMYRFYDRTAFLDDVKDCSLFYKVKSLTIDEMISGQPSFLGLDIVEKQDVLPTYEKLPDDDFTHNTLVPEVTFMYNKKLHIGSIKANLFRGYMEKTGAGMDYLFPFSGPINNYYFDPTTGERGERAAFAAHFVTTSVTPGAHFVAKGFESLCFYNTTGAPLDLDGVCLASYGTQGQNSGKIFGTIPAGTVSVIMSRYLGNSGTYVHNPAEFFFLASNVNFHYMMTVTEIGTSDGMKKVYSRPIAWEYIGNTLSSPIISYPDARATKLTIWLMGDNGLFTYSKSFNLVAHKLLNIAYYLDPNLQNIILSGSLFSTSNHDEVYGLSYEQAIAYPQEATEYDPGKLKVSQVSNPFYFAAEHTYTTSGDIVAMASINEAVSEGTAFGTTPLFIFTKEGIKLMEVGTSGVYYTRMIDGPRDICVNRKGVLPLKDGIIFPSDFGLMYISGLTSKNLSIEMRGVWADNILAEPQLITAANNAATTQLLSHMTEFPFEAFFETFLESCVIGYNYQEDEVMISGKSPSDQPVCFVLCLETGLWHKTTLNTKEFVSCYPRLYRILDDATDTIVHDINKTGTPLQAMMITRPIKFGSTAFKKMAKAVLRCSLYEGEMTDSGPLVYSYEDVASLGRYFRLMVFGSQNCFNWKFIGGVDKMGSMHDISTDVFPVTCKYFRLVFCGTPFYGSRLDIMEFLVEKKYADKPR